MDPRITERPVGAEAVLGRTGFPIVTSATGGEIAIVTGASQAGFNPLDLLYASLAACLAMSARVAANRMGLLGRLEEVRAEVTGEKAVEGLSRVETFQIAITIKGDIDAETRALIVKAAEEEICTVSNTIRATPAFVTTISD
ncbi:OsmC family protein [Sinorhizobium sp. BG8]|uniref:OsmC family protein n=1 Tax=Sinorhizobium sp. BG8 TaxID=2613773 RepID=UPI00193DF061|nr:OsmC family protein [Sinorhizobium sp. BG8]QRM57311.1 OsmC family protein [Sinorhizobium sp. BG8]